MSMHHSPAREVDEAVEGKKEERQEKEINQLDLTSVYLTKMKLGMPRTILFQFHLQVT